MGTMDLITFIIFFPDMEKAEHLLKTLPIIKFDRPRKMSSKLVGLIPV
jgi:hypothetical protein